MQFLFSPQSTEEAKNCKSGELRPNVTKKNYFAPREACLKLAKICIKKMVYIYQTHKDGKLSQFWQKEGHTATQYLAEPTFKLRFLVVTRRRDHTYGEVINLLFTNFIEQIPWIDHSWWWSIFYIFYHFPKCSCQWSRWSAHCNLLFRLKMNSLQNRNETISVEETLT